MLTPQPDKIGSSSMVETFSNMKALFQKDDHEDDNRNQSCKSSDLMATENGGASGRDEHRLDIADGFT